jgi:hypothetical protein
VIAHTRLISRNRFDTSAWKAKDWLGYPIMEPGSWLNNSITGADVKNKSLTAADIKGRLQGPPGARGATGPAGAPGPVGPPGIQRLVSATASKFVPIDAVDSVVALFPAGMVAVSGGSTPTPTDSSSRRPRRAPAGSSDSTRGTGASAERSLHTSHARRTSPPRRVRARRSSPRVRPPPSPTSTHRRAAPAGAWCRTRRRLRAGAASRS